MKDCTKSDAWQDAHNRAKATIQVKKQNTIKAYEINPKRCITCREALPYIKRFNKFCGSSCAAQTNNVKYPKRVRKNKKVQLIKSKARAVKAIYKFNCQTCLTPVETQNYNRKYCSAACASRFRFNENKEKFVNGTIVGHRIARTVLMEMHGAKCFLCGWNEHNVVTKKCPIELDHIDGDAQNTVISNTRLLCPNCHSIQPTYKALNKGKGRHSRLQRYRQGKSY